ncbi:hypothetical protein [Streptacidiphilus sp. MAP5-3]|uniref:hypothetical protein n=1 Tax=unclassified Streptacidiphilus TaxID=2643834 RepID=UPI003511A582
MQFALGRGHRPPPRALTSPVGSGARESPPARRRARSGSEPSTALSDLPARRLLAAIFGPLYLLAAGFFAFVSVNAKPGDVSGRNTFLGFAAVCGLLALIAFVDLLVIRARIAEERRAGLGWRHDRPWVVSGELVEPQAQKTATDSTGPTPPPGPHRQLPRRRRTP